MLLPLVLLMFLPKLMNAADPDAQKVIIPYFFDYKTEFFSF